MKKCGKILLLMMIILLYSCNPKSTDREANTTSNINNEKTICQEVVTHNETPAEYTVELHETIPLDAHAAKSPMLKLTAALEPIKLDNDAATENAIKSISYTISGTESHTLSDAVEKYRQKHISEYKELRADYIDIRSNNEEPIWLNHEFSVHSRCEKGYKGYINYIMDFFEFTGGAHPYSYKSVLTFDSADGNEVTLDKIMKENYEEALLPLITQALMEKFNVATIEELDKIIFNHADLYVSKNVILGEDRITFIYNKYEIAPYAIGEILLEIEYNKLKEVLK